MNYIKHLTGFFDRVIQDRNLNPTHISLYMAIFHAWNINRFNNPISITRDEMMRISQICSKATYHKCMRDLHEKQYIKYQPSFNPYKGSLVTLHSFLEEAQPVQKKNNNHKKNLLNSEQVLNKQESSLRPSTKTTTEQALEPSINYINNTNISKNENVENLDEQAKNFEEINNFEFKIVIPSEVEGTQKEKSSAKKEKEEMPQKIVNEKDNVIARNEANSPNQRSTPTIEKIQTYFKQNNFPELEAQKFFNYFSSIGWLVGGKIPMIDWQAAAQNWMLNSINFNHNNDSSPTNRAKQLNTTTDKNYAEPL